MAKEFKLQDYEEQQIPINLKLDRPFTNVIGFSKYFEAVPAESIAPGKALLKKLDLDLVESTADRIYNVKIDNSNEGSGQAVGIEFNSFKTGIFAVAADATDPTGAGGAATGRIPIVVGGALKYLPYY